MTTIGVELSSLSETWGGMQRYAFQFTHRLRQMRPDHTQLFYFSDVDSRVKRLINQDDHPCFSGVPSRVLREQLIIPGTVANTVDRLLVPAYLGPVVCPVPVDLIVYDFLYLRDDSGLSTRQACYWKGLHRTCLRRADRLFPISEATRTELISRFPECRSKVGPVLYPGSPPRMNCPRPPSSTPSEPFILTVGTISPRKNVDQLIEWYRHSNLADRGISLRIAGQHGWGKPTPETLRGTSDNIVWEGRVSRTRLRELYRAAQLLVQPSSGEGFGLPILEAFSHDLPVVLSSIDVFREVAGRSAWYLPERRSEWDDVIQAALTNHAARRRKVTRGRRRLRLFRWSRTVHRYLTAIDNEGSASS